MQTASRIASVRAIPQPGHKYRWCGLELWAKDLEKRPHPEEKHGLPWPATEVKVFVVDEPKPFDPKANGGVPIEISPATFAMLERDDRIAVRMSDGSAGDSAEIVRTKVMAANLELQLQEVQAQLAEERERTKHLQLAASEQAQELGAKLAATESELHATRAQLVKIPAPAPAAKPSKPGKE